MVISTASFLCASLLFTISTRAQQCDDFGTTDCIANGCCCENGEVADGICADESCVDCPSTTTEEPVTSTEALTTSTASPDPTTTEIFVVTTSTSMASTVDCPECPFNISLVSIGNITIGLCPDETDCECDSGLVSFTAKYLNTASNAQSITFFFDDSEIACPVATDVSPLDDVVCTIDVAGEDSFDGTTTFTIEFADDTISDCSGSFDTSCSTDILGDFGDGCEDLVITSWTDLNNEVCTGNISIVPSESESASSSASGSDSGSSDSDSSADSVTFWQFQNQDSSSSSRRRLLDSSDESESGDSDSDSYDGSISTDWYNNKKCVPNCAQWGAIRGLDCGCFESCTASGLDDECYEGTTAGYCGTGVCCCGGECISNSCGLSESTSSSSDGSRRRLLGSDRCSASADSGDAFYSYAEYYADRCGLSELEEELYFGSDSDSSGSSSSGSRRRILEQSFGAAHPIAGGRNLLSSSDSGYQAQYHTITSSESYDDFLIETCIVYDISGAGTLPDCIQDIVIFLPLCENEFTDFNSTNLNASDITNLITNDTFAAGSNVLTALGVELDGVLGIQVTLIDIEAGSFELCLGNVTVDGETLDTFNVTTIDTSVGTAFVNTTVGSQQCSIDGLPCFNFFFDAECPPDLVYDDSIDRSCECEDGQVAAEFQYVGTQDVVVLFTRGSNQGGVFLGEWALSQDDTVTVLSVTYSRFPYRTWATITDSVTGEFLCVGRWESCLASTVGESIEFCDDLVMLSWTAGDGALCDDIAVLLDDDSDSVSADNILVGGELQLNGMLRVFEEMDPYVRYSLIGVMISFFCLTLVACYICVLRNQNKKANSDSNMEAKVSTMHGAALKRTERHSGEKKDKDDERSETDDEYYDEDADEANAMVELQPSTDHTSSTDAYLE